MLDEHQARVEHAEKKLTSDLQQLARHGRRWRQRIGKGRLALLVGGVVLLGALVVRATRRRSRVVVKSALAPASPSLIGTALRVAAVEAARLAASKLVLRFVGGFERGLNAPQLTASAQSSPRSSASDLDRSSG